MIRYPLLDSHRERYADANEGRGVVPLRVILRLRPGARLAGYDPTNLDNLLARAVVEDATGDTGLPQTSDCYDLPVPLRCLWRSDEGWPLWASTPFFPAAPTTLAVEEEATVKAGLPPSEGSTVAEWARPRWWAGVLAAQQLYRDVSYWHKRVQSGRFTASKSRSFTIRATNGRWMERRVPLPTLCCPRWEADAIGNPDEIARLLKPLAFVGKKRASGFGEVERWEVVALDGWSLVRDDRLTRPLPAMAVHLLDAGRLPEGLPAPVGWTPPEWKPSLFRPGWWSGTPVRSSVDWLAAADALGRGQDAMPA